MAEEGASRVSAPLILLLESVLSLLLAAYLLWKYGDIRKQNPFVSLSTLLVWFLSFFIIFVLPVDVSSAFYRLCLENVTNPVTSPSGSGDWPSSLDCSSYVCTDDVSLYVKNHSPACTVCFQPYSFVCTTPLQILWYIIYWLFFVLSW